MKAGKEYADTIVAKLRKVELSVIEGIRMERMQQLNENMALFEKLFNKSLGGKKDMKQTSDIRVFFQYAIPCRCLC